MRRMRQVFLVAGALAAVASFGISQVSAAPGPVVQVIGDQDLGAPSGQPFEFKQGRIVVRRNTTVTWRNDTVAPHTVTIVNADEFPATVRQLGACRMCEQALMAHAPNVTPQGPMPPFVFALDELKVSGATPARLDGRGDSVVMAEEAASYPSTLGGRIGDTVSAVIAAPEGSTLYYLCAIHPWMQGRIEVVH